MNPILSILMPSIPETAYLTDPLNWYLLRQIQEMNDLHPTLGEVEVLVDNRKKFLSGGPSIGKKRSDLVQRATGKYLCFCDNDDMVSPNYIETLMRLCQYDADVITFRSITKTDFYWSVIDMRLGSDNEEATPDRIVKRNAWHLCPVKSEYAKLYEFDDKNYSEDWNWMQKVLMHCKTEAHTDAILHEYRHSKLISEADKITLYELRNSLEKNGTTL